MLLKARSKKAHAGFKRKKVDALGSFLEIVKGEKKVGEFPPKFASCLMPGGK
jgi:hypothetical protein